MADRFDEMDMAAFEKWLRTYCFQAPPKEAYLMMKDTWDSCAAYLRAEFGKDEITESCANCGNEGADCSRCAHTTESYWMPLPEPPKEQAE